MMFKIFLGTKNAIIFPEKNFEPIWRHFFVTDLLTDLLDQTIVPLQYKRILGKALEAFKVWPPKAIPWATRTLVDTSVKD